VAVLPPAGARAIAARAKTIGLQISVIPAGERWEDGSLRPAMEDWLGAGAIIDNLSGSRSPEAKMAVAAYRASVKTLEDSLRNCSSGKELSRKGRANDILLAADLNASLCVPLLVDGGYTRLLPS
jgi:2-phosphosulfolactate phosphatase